MVHTCSDIFHQDRKQPTFTNADALSRSTPQRCQPTIKYIPHKFCSIWKNSTTTSYSLKHLQKIKNRIDSLSVQGQIDPVENNDCDVSQSCTVVHTSHEDLIFTVGITEKLLNSFQNKVMKIKIEGNRRTVLNNIFEKSVILTRWLYATEESFQESCIQIRKIAD